MKRILALAGFAWLSLTGATATLADEAAVEVSANVALVSDYRFRGVSLSDTDPALQGGFDVSFAEGFSAGVWASNIEPIGDAELEVDLYAGYGFTAGEGSVDVTVVYYTYPGEADANYAEVDVTLTQPAGTGEVSVGVAYVPEQDNVGGEDNTYVHAGASFPLGDTPFSLDAGIGWEDGAFGDDKLDWSLGLSRAWGGLDWSLAYVDTSEDGDNFDAGAVFSVSRTF